MENSVVSPEFIYQFALKKLDALYPKHKTYEPIIDNKTQQLEIESLKHTVKYEQFFFVVDLVERKIKHVHGLSNWLGYADHTFSFLDYFKIMHPHHLASLDMLADSSFETANSKKFEVNFMREKITTQLALKHFNNYYLSTKRSLYPFQFDKSGKVLAYLNHFVILKEYDPSDLIGPRFSNGQKIQLLDEEENVKATTLKSLDKIVQPLKLSKTESAVLKQLLREPDNTNADLSLKLNIPISTIKSTARYRILQKARIYYDMPEIASLKDLVIFVRKKYML
jgi:hypothetical protein